MDLSEGLSNLGLADWLGVAATIVALIGIILSVFLYFRAKAKKTLDYVVARKQSLTTDEAYPNLEIKATWSGINSQKVEPKEAQEHRKTVGGEHVAAGLSPQADAVWGGRVATTADCLPVELKRPALYTIEVWNTGRQAIVRADFTDPISIAVEDGLVVDASVIEKSVAGIIPDGQISANDQTEGIAFRPRLMNPGDWIRISVLVDGGSTAPIVKSWIVGQTRPMKRSEGFTSGDDRIAAVIGLSYGGLAFLGLILLGEALLPATLIAMAVAIGMACLHALLFRKVPKWFALLARLTEQ